MLKIEEIQVHVELFKYEFDLISLLSSSSIICGAPSRFFHTVQTVTPRCKARQLLRYNHRQQYVYFRSRGRQLTHSIRATQVLCADLFTSELEISII